MIGESNEGGKLNGGSSGCPCIYWKSQKRHKVLKALDEALDLVKLGKL
jgi:hypothetical protein